MDFKQSIKDKVLTYLSEKILGKTVTPEMFGDDDERAERERVNSLHSSLQKHYDFGEQVFGRENLSKPEHRHQQTIASYTMMGSKHVNNYLHNKYRNEPISDGKNIGDYQEDGITGGHEDMVKRMDEVVHKHKTPHAMIVHSGVPESPHHIIQAQGGYENKKGGHVVLPAYTSTSISSRTSNNFSAEDSKANRALGAKSYDGKGDIPGVYYKHELKIHVPKGHPGAYVDHHSQSSGEKEFILPRETRLHIHHEPEVDHKMKRVIWHAHIVDHKGNRIEDKND